MLPLYSPCSLMFLAACNRIDSLDYFWISDSYLWKKKLWISATLIPNLLCWDLSKSATKYFHSLIIFVDMPGISSILSRMASILCALFMLLTDSISLPLNGATLLWMGFTWLCHFVREISIHLFRSH